LIVTDVSCLNRVAFEPSEAPLPAEPAERSELDLLALLSHEMRTPLGAMLGFAQLLESGTPAPAASQQRSIDQILQAGWRLDKLIDMARDLSLLRSGAMPLSLGPVPLAAIMLECQAMIESPARMRGVRVALPQLEGPCLVQADAARLQQALGNLLCAAIECSEQGGAVVVDCVEQSPQWIRIVIDRGGSLVQEAAPLEGMGIGVLLARRLVESMGGAMGAETAIGTRNALWFDLKRMPV
jgi:signal transduction histidine kinase